MSNRVTLERLIDMTPGEFDGLPLEQVVMLMEDVADLKAKAKQADEKIAHCLDHRFAAMAAKLRQTEGKETGTVRIQNGDFVLIADLPKKVEWNEEGLKVVEAALREQGEPIEDYIKIRRTVAESAFNAWPSSLQSMFLPHRTVSTGKPSYKLERVKRRAA